MTELRTTSDWSAIPSINSNIYEITAGPASVWNQMA
jgi:hypothetical protein